MYNYLSPVTLAIQQERAQPICVDGGGERFWSPTGLPVTGQVRSQSKGVEMTARVLQKRHRPAVSLMDFAQGSSGRCPALDGNIERLSARLRDCPAVPV